MCIFLCNSTKALFVFPNVLFLQSTLDKADPLLRQVSLLATFCQNQLHVWNGKSVFLRDNSLLGRQISLNQLIESWLSMQFSLGLPGLAYSLPPLILVQIRLESSKAHY